MSRRIASTLSRNALLASQSPCPSHHSVLDVLAPAVYRTSSILSRGYATKARGAVANANGDASTSAAPAKQRPKRSRADAARVRASLPSGVSTAAKQPTRRRKPSPSVSTAETPSAVDLLLRIRSAAPTSTTATGRVDPRSTTQVHNTAVQSLLRGVQSTPEPSFQAAFVGGWIPLRKTGQAARISTRDLEKVLTSTLSADGTYTEEVEELALWVAGESDGRALADWAWRTVEQGSDGCERIVRLWNKIRQGEHLALRSASDGPDHAYRPVSHEGTSGRAGTRRVPPLFFAAYVAAYSVLRQRLPSTDRPSFGSQLVDLVQPTFPALAPLLGRNELSQRLASLSTSSTDADTAAILPTLRQVALAQLYYALPTRPGEGLLREIRSLFVRGQRSRAEELWQDVQVAVEDVDLAWLDRAAWIQSGRRSALEQDLEETSISAESGAGESAPLETENVTTASDASDSLDLAPAAFTQQIVARFLAGFVQAQDMDQANSIWHWLASRDPPLTPGVACWTGLLRGYAARGNVASVESAFVEMQRTPGLEPDYFAWMERVEAYFEAKEPDEAMRVAREMMRDRHVLRDLEQREEGSSAPRFPLRMWNRLQSGLLATNRVRDAEALLGEMEQNGVAPTITTVNAFLKHYTRGTKPDLAGVSRVLQLVADKGLEADVYTFTMLLQALLAVGQRDASAKTIEIMQATGIMPTATTYGALIHSLASTGETEHLRAATQLLDEMETKRMQTNEIVYTSLIQGYLRAGETSTAMEESSGLPQSVAAALTLKQRMERRGIAVPRAAYNVLLSTALAQQTQAGKDLAIRLFREMKQSRTALSRNSAEAAEFDDASNNSVTVADTWYILLDGFSKMNDGAMAGAILREMRESGFVPRSRALQRLVHRIQKGWEM